MISDLMCDSAEEVRAYLKDFPDAYPTGSEIVNLIGAWLQLTDAIRANLDTPPADPTAQGCAAQESQGSTKLLELTIYT